MSITQWSTRWSALREACVRHVASGRWLAGRGEPPRFVVKPPADEKRILEIERCLGTRVPASLRSVLLEYSSAVDIQWQFPERTERPAAFREIFAGECRWDLETLPEIQKTLKGWVDGCFRDASNAYDAIWHNKFAFHEVGNGDMLAIEQGLPGRQPVVYLSHDDGQGHGYWLGADFEDFVDRHSKIGCVGAEDWQWLPFVDGPKSFLQPDGDSARSWREWFGLSVL